MPTHQEIKENIRKQWNEFSGGWKKWDSLIMEALRIQGEELLKKVPGSAFNMLDVAALREAPETKQEEVKSAILSIAKSKAKSDGSFALAWNAWLVTGEKPPVS